MPAPEPLVLMQGIAKTYPTADGAAEPVSRHVDAEEAEETAVHALRDVEFVVDPGEFVAIIGPSGSGKSTLMNLIGCLDVPDEGTYRLAGNDVAGLSDDQLAGIRNQFVGFVFQQWNLLPRTSALENVALPLAYRGDRDRREKAHAALAAVGLERRAGHHPNQLSGGEQQRVAIARALVTEPALILADEPTGSLDSATGREVLSLFERLNRDGKTVVLVTHDPTVAARAHRQIRLSDGRILEDTRARIVGAPVTRPMMAEVATHAAR